MLPEPNPRVPASNCQEKEHESLFLSDQIA